MKEIETVSIEEEIIAEVIGRDATRLSTGAPQPIPLEPMDKQIGGDHYLGLTIQPLEFSMLNGLNPCQHTAVKYIVRRKGDLNDRLQDIDKAIHTLQIYRKMIAEGISI
jgi:hypothetical protein